MINEVVPVSESITHVAVTTSVFFTLAITLVRHTAVCQPFTYQVQTNNIIFRELSKGRKIKVESLRVECY